MNEENLATDLSMEQTAGILDNAPMAVYVSALDNYELLYANEPAKKLFLTADYYPGITCYQAMNYDKPCPFCGIKGMNSPEPTVRKYVHPNNHRIFRVSGKSIIWKNRQAHIEYIQDITEEQSQTEKTRALQTELQDIVNAIPGGVALYKVGDVLEPIYFSDGVPELSGCSAEEYRKLVSTNPEKLVYYKDIPDIKVKVQDVIKDRSIGTFEYRKQHRNGQLVWVRMQVGWMGVSEDGYPMIHCVFHNITEQKESELETEHMLHAIPGGIASYRIENGSFVPTYFSDGVLALSGHSREELWNITQRDAFAIILESDKKRVMDALESALDKDQVLDISYRIYHKNGKPVWVHMNGRCMDPVGEGMRFYAVFTGMSAEARLFQNISSEMADGIYVISRDNYDLLYVSETVKLFPGEKVTMGQKCYAALHGKDAPCEFCTLNSHEPDGKKHEMVVPGASRFYSTHFREMDWNGIPAYVKYVQDNTKEVLNHRERQRLEEYFQTVVDNLPGGIAVVRHEPDGRIEPEYMSDGFASMMEMTLEEAWHLYMKDAMAGVHPDDREMVSQKISAFLESGERHYKISYRLRKGDGSYLWVRNTLSAIQKESGVQRVYSSYQDITGEREHQEQLRQKYNEQIIQYYHTRGADSLIAGHCNITQNRIVEMLDHTDSKLLERFGSERDLFFTGIAGLIVDEEDRQKFLNVSLNKPAREAFERGVTELKQKCFVKMPGDNCERYVQFTINMFKVPDTNDITGILTIMDITEETITNRIYQQISVTGYDLIEDVDLKRDYYRVIENLTGADISEQDGCYSERIAKMVSEKILPKDAERACKMLDKTYILERLKSDGAYSFPYSVLDKDGDVLTKNLTVSSLDLRLGRVCLARTDITESIQEQQRLLNIIAYTFDMLVFVNIKDDQAVMYTRKTVLENLPPHNIENYSKSVEHFFHRSDLELDQGTIEEYFQMDTLVRRLEDTPAGYDFVVPCQEDGGQRYKQINVLWGDRKHRTVCMVRADVTDMLATEHQVKETLEHALELAEEANLAKSDFLSSMSHDIRTPMNAVTGMTMLAMAHLDSADRVEGYLKKIALSSKHLLSLINDILDMNKIERSGITLNRMQISITEMTNQLYDMIAQQAFSVGVQFRLQMGKIIHPYFYGDALRINQILINILSNAVKFTPEGGSVDFLVEEMEARQEVNVRYRFKISDTGVGMSEDFLEHIFEPFTRGRNVTRVEGSGLGLSIVKGLVDLMGGDIAVESRLREGTTFLIELECEAAQSENRNAGELAKDSSVSSEELFKGRCFLVAEDNEINAEILCELLQMYGASTVLRTDGVQTVQEFWKTPEGTYDAILMDVQMPYMNGYDATRQIRGLDRKDASRIPIVAMTANAFEEDVRAALDAGMDAHVAKPIEMEVLCAALRKVLQDE